MTINLKKIFKFTFICFISIFIALIPRNQVRADNSVSRYAWRDESGNIIFKATDKKATSSYRYMTVGYTITRCVLGTKNAIDIEYFTYRCDNPFLNETPSGGGLIVTDYTLSESQFLSDVASVNSSWLADIESGETCFIKIDAIMINVDYTLGMEFPIYSGWLNSKNNQDYLINPVADYPGVWDKFTKDGLVNHTYGWADRNKIYNHFDIYLCYNGGQEDPEELPIVEETKNYVTMEPQFVTWNSNDVGGQSGNLYVNNRVGEYDISQGIPSGESITNGVGASQWFGQYAYGWHEIVKDYTINYTIKYQIYEHQHSLDYTVTRKGSRWTGEYDEDGDKIYEDYYYDETMHDKKDWFEHTAPMTKTGDKQTIYEYQKKAGYYYVQNAEFYHLEEIDVYNDVYPEDKLVYDYGWDNITVDYNFDGKQNSTDEGNPLWLQNNYEDVEKHVTFYPNAAGFGKKDIIEQTLDLGRITNVDEEIKKAVSNIKSSLDDDEPLNGSYGGCYPLDPMGNVNSQNDKLYITIGGTLYEIMQYNEQEHCWDTSEKAKKYLPLTLPGITDQNFWKYKEQGQTVTIPKTVANGSYHTDMDVVYKRYVLNDGRIMAFSTGTTISIKDKKTGEFYNKKITIEDHIKSGFEPNEPVWVLTPVVAPITIKGEDKVQLVTPHKTTTGLKKDDSNKYVDGTTTDHKAMSEMVLDNMYDLVYDPEQWHEYWTGYNKRDYDKYIKDRQVRFPFDVFIKNKSGNLEYYKASDGGYTEWITVFERNLQNVVITDLEQTRYHLHYYIPPWALETSYAEIEYKVEAYNVDDEHSNNHSNDQNPYANDDNRWDENYENYVATFKIPIELSGVIYDFEIIGCDNYGDYNKDITDEGTTTLGNISFALNKASNINEVEKKQGTYNRFGNAYELIFGTEDIRKYRRYTLDGDITVDWKPNNTLPLSMGTSNSQFDKGYVKLGEQFTYSLKTIANLWNEEDHIQIIPKFRYYNYKNNELYEYDDVQVYYWENEQPIRVGSKKDLKNVTEGINNVNFEFSFANADGLGSYTDSLSLQNDLAAGNITIGEASSFYSNRMSDYNGDYHDEDLLYTIAWNTRDMGLSSYITKTTAEKMATLIGKSNKERAATINKFFSTKAYTYCMSYIHLNKTNRLFSGNYEELSFNAKSSKNALTMSAFPSIDAQSADKMKYSMQTWYGTYYIPKEIMICKADTFSNLGASDYDGDGVIDLNDYIHSKYQTYDTDGNFVEEVKKDAPYWLNNDYPYGYLILNFDITAYKGATPHLSYIGSGGATLDMWKRQNPKTSVPVGNPDIEHTSGGLYPTVDIPLKSGDIAIINVGEKAHNFTIQDLF